MGKNYDVITSKNIVAKKEYTSDGLSVHSAINYKIKEAFILEKINRNLIFGKRYNSNLFRLRCILLRQKYAMHSHRKIFYYSFDFLMFPFSFYFLYMKKFYFGW